MSQTGLQKHPRYALAASVDVVTTTAEILVLSTVNISMGGVFLQTATPPPMGTELRMRLRADTGAVGLFGRVVHVIDEASSARKGHPPGIGVQFEGLPAPTQELLRQLVDALAAKAEQQKLRHSAVVFVDAGTVTVKPQRSTLQQLWDESLRHGGLFVPGHPLQPAGLALGAAVRVVIGPIELAAEIVHLEPRGGAGLQIKDLAGPKLEALTGFLNSSEEILLYQEVRNVGAPLAKLLADARRLFIGIEANDPLAAIGLPSGANDDDVRRRLATLREAFAAPPGDATPPQIARLQQTALALSKVAALAVERASTKQPPTTASTPPPTAPSSPPTPRPGSASFGPMPSPFERPRPTDVRDAVRELLQAAGDLERRGDRAGARKSLCTALELAPDHPELLKRLAVVDDAINLARAADLIKNAEVFVQGVGMKDQAIAHAKEALTLTVAREVRLRAVRVLAKAGGTIEAIYAAQDLLDDDPKDALALAALLHLYEKTEQWINAVRTGEALLRLKPDDHDLAKKLKGFVDQARRPSASRTGMRPPSRTDLRPPSRTDLRPPSRTDLRPPSRTDLRPASRTDLRPPPKTDPNAPQKGPGPSWADLLPTKKP